MRGITRDRRADGSRVCGASAACVAERVPRGCRLQARVSAAGRRGLSDSPRAAAAADAPCCSSGAGAAAAMRRLHPWTRAAVRPSSSQARAARAPVQQCNALPARTLHINTFLYGSTARSSLPSPRYRAAPRLLRRAPRAPAVSVRPQSEWAGVRVGPGPWTRAVPDGQSEFARRATQPTADSCSSAGPPLCRPSGDPAARSGPGRLLRGSPSRTSSCPYIPLRKPVPEGRPSYPTVPALLFRKPVPEGFGCPANGLPAAAGLAGGKPRLRPAARGSQDLEGGGGGGSGR